MQILLVGLNYRSAPVDIRERVSVSKEQMPQALAQLETGIGESVILSTCNRTEIYAAPAEPSKTVSEIEGFLRSYRGLGRDGIGSYLYRYEGPDAARHLFRVASGLDSMILGESQILGQVRDALVAASNACPVSVPLSRLFHGALRAGRRVREETEIGRNALSVSYAGVNLASQVLGRLTGKRALLVGAGEAGELVARALQNAGVNDLVISNRTRERAEEVSRRLGGTAIPFSDIGPATVSADIVITATESEGYVVTPDTIKEAVEGRGDRPLFLFDLAVPRDIDPRVADMANVRLFNIDDLSSIAENNLQARQEAAGKAEQIVEEELTRFISWWDSLEAVNLVKTLRQQAEQIRQRELSKALERLPDLSPDDRTVVETLTRSLVTRILHDPTVRLKQSAGKAHIQAFRDLFVQKEQNDQN